MSRAASYSTVSGQPRTFAIAGSLLLVSISYVLLLSAPVITRHLRSMVSGVSGVGGVRAFEWLPLACGAGLVLGGASALVFVLTQIAREAERRPYVCLAPVLAAFAACILIGLRADLPLKGVASEQVAVFGLALSVVGGTLVQTSRVSAQMMGLGFTFMPPLSLFAMLWTLSGKIDPAQVVWALSAPSRAFLGMLTLSSFAIAAVATFGRRSEPVSARLPRDKNESYVIYDIEDELLADQARLRARGLPGWAIVLAAAAAVALGFMALKVFLERRAAINFLAPSSRVSAPVQSSPSVEPTAPEVSPSAPQLGPSEVAPALVPALEEERDDEPAPSDAPPEQQVRAQIAPQAAAPELAHKAAKVARPARGSHKPGRADRKLIYAAPKVAPIAKSAASEPVAPKLEPKPEAKPVEAKKPEKPKSVADLALQAASIAGQNAHSKASSEPKSAAESDLDALMDNSLQSDKGAKKQKANDDPIYGL